MEFFLFEVYKDVVGFVSVDVYILFVVDVWQLNYIVCNVIVYIFLKKKLLKYIVFIVYYDYFGCMGQDIYFLGGNDNVLGMVMLLEFVLYFCEYL